MTEMSCVMSLKLSAVFILACNSCRPEQVVRSSLVNAGVHTCDTKLC